MPDGRLELVRDGQRRDAVARVGQEAAGVRQDERDVWVSIRDVVEHKVRGCACGVK